MVACDDDDWRWKWKVYKRNHIISDSDEEVNDNDIETQLFFVSSCSCIEKKTFKILYELRWVSLTGLERGMRWIKV
jgi:hypothetical protein